MSKTETVRVRRFIIELGKTMHEYGALSHQLENRLAEVTALLGLHGEFALAPTSMSFVFRAPGSDEEFTHIARVSPRRH